MRLAGTRKWCSGPCSDHRVPHQDTGDGKRAFERRRDAELLDEVERLQAVALVADKVPGFAGRRGALDLSTDGTRKVVGLLRIQKIPAADEASHRMLHAIGMRRHIL
ncbi:MAG: hypothetical protein M0P22_01585 [Methanoculleus sp.]|nr:hypothetical protein [Methanoculleus sp.]